MLKWERKLQAHSSAMLSQRKKINRRLSANCFPFSIFFCLIYFFCFCHVNCCAKYILNHGECIIDNGTTLVSSGGNFVLGFFTPRGSSRPRKFVGIWYDWDPDTVVWVANRDKPVFNGSNAVFGIADDGNLNVWDLITRKNYWSTGLEKSSPTSRTVKLEDSGNLVLSDNQSLEKSLWTSFKYPTDTFLPGMSMDENLKLTSWVDDDDPGIGDFTFKQDQEGEGRYVISKEPVEYWRSRIPDKFSSWDEIPFAVAYFLSGFSRSIKPSKNDFQFQKNKTLEFLTKQLDDYNYTRLVMNYTGILEFRTWDQDKHDWTASWRQPEDNCSVENVCGKFGSCNIKNTGSSFLCRCLPGFKPSNPGKWNSGEFSDGCITGYSTSCPNDTFLSLKMMKVGSRGTENEDKSEAECRNLCLGECKCKAYSYQAEENSTRKGETARKNVCWTWSEDLSNLQEEYAYGGRNLSVRVAKYDIEGEFPKPSEAPSEAPSAGKTRLPLILEVLVPLIFVIGLTCSVIYVWRRKMAKRQEIIRSDKRNRVLRTLDSEKHVKSLIDSGEFREEDEKDLEVPFFYLESILVATDSFSDANKLGQGGFGPVYKGTFPGGQEIAVKRLSSVSGQGLQEFKNEVVLIAKLQHRNLVRLRGFCIEGDEKILLYEYMPNKSLDSFLFDPKRSVLLDWKLRSNIILGIARGLLYLHQDSRLRIIHRDLKTSNILLDEEMNPKISDFGLARIVGGKATGDNTTRVVGTYGYMSPEYALEGVFSVKSDVFSFGVVLLEILSGRKNTGFYQSDQALSLIGYAWRLWVENKVLDLMDETLREVADVAQFVRFVNIALLCVQEDPSDRPNMSLIVTMLDSEIATVPTPKRAAFVPRRVLSSTPTTSSGPDTVTDLTSSLGEIS